MVIVLILMFYLSALFSRENIVIFLLQIYHREGLFNQKSFMQSVSVLFSLWSHGCVLVLIIVCYVQAKKMDWV